MRLKARDVTQGGQVIKYMVGMFLQIINIAAWWALIVSTLIFLLWMRLRLTLQAFVHGSAWWWMTWGGRPLALASGHAPDTRWTFHFQRANGEVVTFSHTAAQVLADPYFIQMGRQVKETLCVGAGMAAFSFVALMGAVAWYLGRQGARQRASEVTGGRILVNGVKPVNRLVKKAGRRSPLNIAGLHLIRDTEMQNIGLHGTVGSGKSAALNDLLCQLRARGDRVIVYDKGNNFIPIFYRQDKDKILNPFDARCAPWDLWAECQSISDFENFATALLPDGCGSHDPFWILSARSLFVAAARKMASDPDRSIARLLKTLMSATLADLRDYLQGTEAVNLVDGSIEKTAMTIRAILTTYVRSLRYLQGLDQSRHPPFNLRDWLATEDARGDNPWVFISSDGRHHLALKPLLSAWLYITMTGILALSADRHRRIWIIYDELQSLHKLPLLPEFCAEARKFGGCTVIGIQNFPQLKEQFGANFAEAIWDLLNTRIFYRAPSGSVAAWVQKELGEKRHKKFRDQYSFGLDIIRDGVTFSRQEISEYLVSYSDVQRLNDLECFITLPGDWPVTRMTLRYKSYRKVAADRIARPVETMLDADLEDMLRRCDDVALTGGLAGKRRQDPAATGTPDSPADLALSVPPPGAGRASAPPVQPSPAAPAAAPLLGDVMKHPPGKDEPNRF